ncbi:MAG TPA: HlyD family efflux transporter periplasmic adaptor subunit [Acidobacteriota bacterium]|nr:HlyD family efflux transporter periplasmic adaptor subunit [Acidobacteriota bacterium]
MDIPRPFAARKRYIRRALYLIIAIAAVTLITLGVSRLKPAAPSVDRATVWPDTVKRGPMLRQVHGLGTLVPEDIRWIPATTQGRVERILVKPGALVNPDTILLELSNPELQRDLLDAEMQVKGAEADYTSLRVRLEKDLLDQQANAATVQANYSQAKLEAQVNEDLAKQGLIADLPLKVSKVRAEELATRNEIERKRLAINAEAVKAQLAAQQARVEQYRGLYRLKRSQVEALRVRAGTIGVLALMNAERGQQVTPGEKLARVADPSRLKAELKIAETQAKDIQIGQRASIDTRNGIAPGHVVRTDPAVQNGTVTVDVTLDGPLPQGARPDLSVDGTIELERLDNVLYVGRPAFGQEKSVISLFKLEEGGNSAVRVQVKVGRTSVNFIEIVDGLKAGDQVILSDMSAWDGFDKVRLK